MKLEILRYFGGFGAGLVLALVLLPVVIWAATRYNALSRIDFRRKNKKRTPLWGGAGIYLSFSVVGLIFAFEQTWKISLLSLPLIVMGMMDDIYQFRPRLKSVVQLLLTMGWIYLVPGSELVLVQAGVPYAFAVPLTVFWVVGIINAINMIDGMDGEATTYATITTLFMLMIVGGGATSLQLAIFAGACIAFLGFNLKPAKVYLGDSGSTFIGFYLATTAASIKFGSSSPGIVLVVLFLFAFPEVDVVLAMFRRVLTSASLFRGDHDHIHHKLQKIGCSVYHALAIIAGVTVYSGITAMGLTQSLGSNSVWYIGTLSTLGMLGLLGSIYFNEHRQAHQVSNMSRTIFHDFMDISNEVEIDRKDFSAVVYDLLPYYKELQMRGVSDVTEFIQSIAEHLKHHHPKAQFALVGSYSVIAIERPSAKEVTWVKKSLAEAYYRLLEDYEVLKTENPVPWGMFFYSNRSKGEAFLRKFGLVEMDDYRVKLKRAG